MGYKNIGKKPVIEATEKGPFIVYDLEDLYDCDWHPLPATRVMALCRCGKSKNKPYCDGTHTQFDFNTDQEDDGEKDFRKDFVGKKITIHDNRAICSHAGFCTGGLPSVWRREESPWIDPDSASPEKIKAVIKKCPSGALSYSVDGVEHRDYDRRPAIHVTKDGPLFVVGKPELPKVKRMVKVSEEHYALCRCGGSKNKPFCDGSHRDINFKDDDKD